MRAFVFPGQGAQYEGMGNDIIERLENHEAFFAEANEILGFDIQTIMCTGTAEELKQTKVTQPAIYLHSIADYLTKGSPSCDAVAGHSLGEFSALVAANVFTWQDGLSLVYQRAMAMQAACDDEPGTMAAILGLDDQVVEEICEKANGIVVAANYNCPGQLVISGAVKAVENAVELAKEAGAKRALLLPVGGAFHSPLMASAQERLSAAIDQTIFSAPSCPIYQNFTAKPSSDTAEIKENLKAQLTGPVRWTQSMQAMIANGVDAFAEVGGNGKVLAGLHRKIDRSIPIQKLSEADV
jgi:[acyl-carrier-protein] S-malonyltransferase